MGLYDERLKHDLDSVRRRVRRMGVSVVEALKDATRSVLVTDRELATRTILGDLPINRQARDLDERCHVFIARHLPSAGHLRFISSAMRLSKTLERIGDYAETIARAAAHLSKPPAPQVQRGIELLARHATEMLAASLKAYDEASVVEARATRARVGGFGKTFDSVFDALIESGHEDRNSIDDLFSLAAVCTRLERILHQAKNICEQTLFAVTGERKEEKTFDFLFVDTNCAGASQYAVAYCRRAYAEAGTFRCAGWSETSEAARPFIDFAATKGLDLETAIPAAFDDIRDHVSDFDLVIDLDGTARKHIKKIPFHTTLLRWPLAAPESPEDVHKELASQLGELMEILRGEDTA